MKRIIGLALDLATLTAMYFWLIEGVDVVGNFMVFIIPLMAFMMAIALIAFFFADTDDIKKMTPITKLRQAQSLLTDTIGLIALIWFGHLWLAGFWFMQAALSNFFLALAKSTQKEINKGDA